MVFGAGVLMDKSRFLWARGVASLSDMRTKVGCTLVNEQGVSFGGCNRRLDSSGPPFSIHAEEDALLGCTMGPTEAYLYRETRRGVIADSKPCARCTALLEDAGVRVVYYTSAHGPHFRRIVLD